MAGAEGVAEQQYNTSGTLLRRYLYGSGVDDPVVMYDGANFTTPRYYHRYTGPRAGGGAISIFGIGKESARWRSGQSAATCLCFACFVAFPCFEKILNVILPTIP